MEYVLDMLKKCAQSAQKCRRTLEIRVTGCYRPTTTSAALDGLSRRLPSWDQIGNRYQRLLDSKHEDADLRRGFYVTPYW